MLLRIFSAVFAIILAISLLACQRFDQKQVFDTWQVEEYGLRVRVTAYNENNPFASVSGAFYVFESSSPSREEWHEIFVFRHDDPVPINKRSVHIVSESVTYVYMGWIYAVTTDGGKTWSLWDSRDHNFVEPNFDYGVIETVDVGDDGIGKMLLRVFPSKNSCHTLVTADFGRVWTNGAVIDDCKR